MDDDDELITSLASGDDTALRELLDRHEPWLAGRLWVIAPLERGYSAVLQAAHQAGARA
jgi:hypothetical protein